MNGRSLLLSELRERLERVEALVEWVGAEMLEDGKNLRHAYDLKDGLRQIRDETPLVSGWLRAPTPEEPAAFT